VAARIGTADHGCQTTESRVGPPRRGARIVVDWPLACEIHRFACSEPRLVRSKGRRLGDENTLDEQAFDDQALW
jgi:hypothetical protein